MLGAAVGAGFQDNGVAEAAEPLEDADFLLRDDTLLGDEVGGDGISRGSGKLRLSCLLTACPVLS